MVAFTKESEPKFPSPYCDGIDKRDELIAELQTSLAFERWAKPVDRWMVRLALFALGWILGAGFVSWPF